MSLLYKSNQQHTLTQRTVFYSMFFDVEYKDIQAFFISSWFKTNTEILQYTVQWLKYAGGHIMQIYAESAHKGVN